jgi:hypothetical protein
VILSIVLTAPDNDVESSQRSLEMPTLRPRLLVIIKHTGTQHAKLMFMVGAFPETTSTCAIA